MDIAKMLKQELSEEYFEKKERNENEYESKKKILNAEHPRLEEIDTDISLTALRCARKIIDKTRTAEDVSKEMLETLSRLKAEREEYIAKNNIDPSYINPSADCKICNDTGYVDGKMCKCMKTRLVEKLYELSHMTDENKKCTFNKFKLDYYPDRDENNLGITPLENIKEVLRKTSAEFIFREMPEWAKRTFRAVLQTTLFRAEIRCFIKARTVCFRFWRTINLCALTETLFRSFTITSTTAIC